MREQIRRGICTAFEMTKRFITEGNENASYFYGKVLGRYGLYWISMFPEIYNYRD